MREANARMQHCDKAGPSGGRAGKAGRGPRGGSFSARTSCFQPSSNAPSHPRLEKKRGPKERSSTLRLARAQERNKMATLASPVRPFPLLPATGCKKLLHATAAAARPKENQRPAWRGQTPSKAAASRPHLPFDAMSAHARTGRQVARFQPHRAPTPRGLSRPASCVAIYVSRRLRTAAGRTKCARAGGARPHPGSRQGAQPFLGDTGHPVHWKS